jgi:flagellar hook-associated protein 3 FlgL
VTYQGNTSTAQTQIGPSSTATAQVPGENNSGSGAPGLFADSRTGSDLFNHLIALQQDLAAGNTTAISSTDSPAITQDDNHIITQISANGVMQAGLNAASSMASTATTDIATQISGETNADLAQTMTQLSQTQTAYQAALESGAMMMKTSLLNYIQ